MPEFTQFKEDYPIIRDVPISSKAEGTAKVAEVFGTAAKGFAETAVAMKKEQKEALILHDSNRIIEVANQAKQDILLQPDMAMEIHKKATETATSILNGVPSEYREKVRSHYDVHMGSVGMEAARTVYKQHLIRGRIALNQEIPLQYENLLNTSDPDKFEKDARLLVDVINNAALAGYYSPKAAANKIQQIKDIQQRHEDMHRLAEQGGTAHQYSHADNFTFTNDHTNTGIRPSEEHHEMVAGHYDLEKTYNSALEDASAGVFPDQSTVDHLTKDQYTQVKNRLTGALGAKASNDVGHTYDYNAHRIAELKAAPELSQTHKGELQYREGIINGLKAGDFKQIMMDTNSGARRYESWNQNRTAILGTQFNGNSPQEAQQNKQLALQKNDTELKRGLISDADAMGIPRNFVNVLNDQDMIPINASFTGGSDVTPAINAVYQMPKDMPYYATIPLKNPVQKAALYSVALRRNSMPDGQPADIYSQRIMKAAQEKTAEQQAFEDKVLKRGEDETTPDSKIRLNVESALSSTLGYIRGVPEGRDNTSQEWAGGTVELGVNYVKNRMIETGDYSGSHMSRYVDEFAAGQNNNYKIYSGMNVSWNMNESSLTRTEVEALANFELQHHFDRTREHGGNTLSEMAQDMMHPHVVNTRDGSVAIVAPDGSVLHSEPITPSLVNAAMHAAAERQRGLNEAMQKQGKGNPFPQNAPANNLEEKAQTPKEEKKYVTPEKLKKAEDTGLVEVGAVEREENAS